MGPCKSTGGVHETSKKVSAFKSADDMVDYDTLFPAGSTKSAVSRHCTKEVWEEYKDKKDASGVSFKTCIFSGVKNLDSGIGAYAGSHDSYKTFNKLFDKIIEEYHGHGVDAKHVSNMDATSLVNADFTPEESAMVNSTRIRVGRNLAGYPLGPGITREQRNEIMTKVTEAL
jgi:hypothetical protein